MSPHGNEEFKISFHLGKPHPADPNRVLYVPKHYAAHQEWIFPGWDAEEVFGKQAPLLVEYCSGNGEWIVEKALKNPDCHWIAVEKRFHRVKKICQKILQLQLKNLFIVCGEALTFTQHYVRPDSLEGIYINFPDPWPKNKHVKHRLLDDRFMQALSLASQKGAKTTLVTDHAEYAERICEMVMSHTQWAHVFPAPYFVTEWQDYGASFFDGLWRTKGKTIYYLQFVNQK